MSGRWLAKNGLLEPVYIPSQVPATVVFWHFWQSLINGSSIVLLVGCVVNRARYLERSLSGGQIRVREKRCQWGRQLDGGVEGFVGRDAGVGRCGSGQERWPLMASQVVWKEGKLRKIRKGMRDWGIENNSNNKRNSQRGACYLQAAMRNVTLGEHY